MRRYAAATGLIALLALGIGPTTAPADFSPEIKVEAVNAAGEPESRAGAHPDSFVITIASEAGSGEAEDLKDQVVDFPAGFGGDPGAVSLCPRWEFDQRGTCPPSSQVGLMTITGDSTEELLIYSLEPGPNEAAVFGVSLFINRLKLISHLRPADYGLSMRLDNLVQGKGRNGSVRETRFEFWGVPADHHGASIPRRAFLTNPTRCGEPLAVTVRARTWQEPDKWVATTASTGVPLTGCQDLPFEPGLGLGLSNPGLDSPTGIDLDLTVPSSADPDGRVSSQVKDVSIALPEGMALSPAGAVGLSTCSDAQFGLAVKSAPGCPPSSRVGSVELAASQLRRPLRGAIYLGQETAEDRFRLFVLARGSGVELGFAGSMSPDPGTGQLTARLSNLPQVAFDRLDLRFDGGPRALLAAPLSCGPATAVATFTPYSGAAPVRSSAAVTIGGPDGSRCPGTAPFEPSFAAGTTGLRAGRPTSFSTTVHRRDGEQLPDRFSIALPSGLSAALGSVDLCPASGAAGDTCPGSSRVGAAVAEIGSGPNPAVLTGDVYLTGPYRRAPFGFVLSFRATIGPFDLGRFVIRAALRLDPFSNQITVDTDSLPRVVGGVPIRFQTIGLDIDRPGFIRNPTSCAPRNVTATIRSTGGAISHAASRFGSRGCLALPFRPATSMSLTDRSEFHDRGHPGLRITMKVPRGGANLRAANFSLPRLLRLDASSLREICARGEAIAGNCPKASRVGSGYARTPLLDRPLRGSIYLVQPRGEGAPDIWTSLKGGGLDINLRGETATEGGRVETKLVDMPDFPLASFAMRLAGGKHGAFALTKNPCSAPARDLIAPIAIEGQNGALRRTRSRVAVCKQ